VFVFPNYFQILSIFRKSIHIEPHSVVCYLPYTPSDLPLFCLCPGRDLAHAALLLQRVARGGARAAAHRRRHQAPQLHPQQILRTLRRLFAQTAFYIGEVISSRGQRKPEVFKVVFKFVFEATVIRKSYISPNVQITFSKCLMSDVFSHKVPTF
jgi:hypothetical protein